VIVLVLTILFFYFTAITKRAISIINIVKTRLHIGKKNIFLKDYLILYIEREITTKFSIE